MKSYSKNQEASITLKVVFAVQKWPHLHRAYLVTVCNRSFIAVFWNSTIYYDKAMITHQKLWCGQGQLTTHTNWRSAIGSVEHTESFCSVYCCHVTCLPVLNIMRGCRKTSYETTITDTVWRWIFFKHYLNLKHNLNILTKEISNDFYYSHHMTKHFFLQLMHD